MLLLAIIYLGFICLGLPDSLFGSAWPVLQLEFEVPVSYAGFVTVTTYVCTIISSLFTEKITRKISTGLLTAISVGMTALALLGFAFSTRFWMLILFAIPMGLGAGCVDAALNNYMAIRYSSKHLSWLHCFWGVGAIVSPYIMSYWLKNDSQWNKGYLNVGIIQCILTVILFASLPLWKKGETKSLSEENSKHTGLTYKEIFALKGIKENLFSFFAYCSIEGIAFSWTSSYFVSGRGINAETAAKYAALFYIGMSLSRLVTGFFSDRVGDKNMIRLGCFISLAGVIITLIPFTSVMPAIIGIFVLGFGCGPIYPAIMHSTPTIFGEGNSQAIVGLEMAFAYVGSTVMPPLFGIVARHFGLGLYPVFLCIFVLTTIVLTERLNKKVKR